MKRFWWPWCARRTSHLVFLQHLDEEATVRLYCHPDDTYGLRLTERDGLTEHDAMEENGLTLFDACLYLGVIMGLHAGEYQATHGAPPPYLAQLRTRLSQRYL